MPELKALADDWLWLKLAVIVVIFVSVLTVTHHEVERTLCWLRCRKPKSK